MKGNVDIWNSLPLRLNQPPPIKINNFFLQNDKLYRDYNQTLGQLHLNWNAIPNPNPAPMNSYSKVNPADYLIPSRYGTHVILTVNFISCSRLNIKLK